MSVNVKKTFSALKYDPIRDKYILYFNIFSSYWYVRLYCIYEIFFTYSKYVTILTNFFSNLTHFRLIVETGNTIGCIVVKLITLSEISGIVLVLSIY